MMSIVSQRSLVLEGHNNKLDKQFTGNFGTKEGQNDVPLASRITYRELDDSIGESEDNDSLPQESWMLTDQSSDINLNSTVFD